MFLKRKILCIAFGAYLFLCISELHALTDKDLTVYRDDTYKFSLHYPQNWSPVPPTHKKTRIKIVNENGSGDCDCGVNVQYVPEAKNMKAKDAIAQISDPKIIQNNLRSSIPDATIIKNGRTFLSNQEAIYHIVKFTFRSFGLEVPIKMIMIQTVKREYVYTVSCRCLFR